MEKSMIRKAQELAVKVMKACKNDSVGKTDPKVGAAILDEKGNLFSCNRGKYSNGEHAEYGLLERVCPDKELNESIFFTTLEPCFIRSSEKRSCSLRIVRRHIMTVYIGMTDPDPTVAGKGIKLLQDSGILVKFFDSDLQKEIYNENQKYIDEADFRASSQEHACITKEESSSFINSYRSDFSFEQVNKSAINAIFKKGNSFYRFKNNQNSLLDFFVKKGLVKKENDVYLFTNEFILLFANRPSDYLLNSKIKLKNAFGGDETIDSPLVLVPKIIEKWVKKQLPFSTSRLDSPTKSNEYIFPIDTINEAVINALVHRDYSIINSFIQISISSDYIKIKSPGDVVKPQTLSQLEKFTASSVSRNYGINYVFSQMDFVDNNNRGMDLFRGMPEKNHIPSPIYEYIAPILNMTFYYSFDLLVKNVRQNYDSAISDEEIKIVELIKTKKSITSKEALEILQLSNNKAAQRLLTSLVEKKQICSSGKTKGTIYYI